MVWDNMQCVDCLWVVWAASERRGRRVSGVIDLRVVWVALDSCGRSVNGVTGLWVVWDGLWVVWAAFESCRGPAVQIMSTRLLLYHS